MSSTVGVAQYDLTKAMPLWLGQINIDDTYSMAHGVS